MKKIFIMLLVSMLISNYTPINAAYEEPVSFTESNNYLGSVEFDINENGTKYLITANGEVVEIVCEEAQSTYANAGLRVKNKKYTVNFGAVSFSFQISTKAEQVDDETWYTRFTNVEALSVSGPLVSTQELKQSIITEKETASMPAKAEAYGKYTVTGLGASTVGVVIKIKNAKVTLETYGS